MILKPSSQKNPKIDQLSLGRQNFTSFIIFYYMTLTSDSAIVKVTSINKLDKLNAYWKSQQAILP